jgi:hypothetical protein
MRTIFHWVIVLVVYFYQKKLFKGNGQILVTLVCLLLPRWRSASIALGLFLVPVVPVLYFFIPESPTWLDSKGRYADRSAANAFISRLSGVAVADDKDANDIVENNSVRKTKIYTIKDLFSSKKLAKLTALLCFLWFASSLASFGT